MRSSGKNEILQFFFILGQKGQFWTVFGQHGKNGNFFSKKRLEHFLRLQALTNCKVSEKSNERFSRNYVTNAQTNGRTGFLRSRTTLSRDQKTRVKQGKHGISRSHWTIIEESKSKPCKPSTTAAERTPFAKPDNRCQGDTIISLKCIL